MTTPHHNKKQKVCKDIIAYPEEKTNKKHQIPPHKRKGSSRKKNHIRHMSMWYILCCPPLRSRLPRKGAGFSALGGRIGLRVAASFLAGFPGRFPPPSAALLICFVAYFRVQSRPLCGSRLFPFLASFFVRFYFPVRPSYLLLPSGLMLRSSFPSDFLFLHFYFIAFFYFHFLYKKGAGQNKIK